MDELKRTSTEKYRTNRVRNLQGWAGSSLGGLVTFAIEFYPSSLQPAYGDVTINLWDNFAIYQLVDRSSRSRR